MPDLDLMSLFYKITPYIPYWKEMLPEIKVILLGMSPVLELRGAIPMGMFHYGLSAWQSYFLGVTGNVLVLIPVSLFLKYFVKSIMKMSKLCDRFFTHVFDKTRKKHSTKIKVYGALALVLVVAIPIPGTGGWTGALIAYVFGLPIKKSLPLVSLGVALAGLIVLTLSAGIEVLI